MRRLLRLGESGLSKLQSVTFDTFQEDSSLHRMEVRVSITAAKQARDGTQLSYTAVGSVHMRN